MRFHQLIKIILIFSVLAGVFYVFYGQKRDNPSVSANIKEYLNKNNWKEYKTNEFSFRHSEKLKITGTLNEGNEVIIAEDDKFGFQIFIMPFDESRPITKERIWQDMPDMEINDSGEAMLDGAKTLVFYGYNEDIGETFEIWAVHKGKLYQIMTGKNAEELLIGILETWDWKN